MGVQRLAGVVAMGRLAPALLYWPGDMIADAELSLTALTPIIEVIQNVEQFVLPAAMTWRRPPR